jgi:hypothetical protein
MFVISQFWDQQKAKIIDFRVIFIALLEFLWKVLMKARFHKNSKVNPTFEKKKINHGLQIIHYFNE